MTIEIQTKTPSSIECDSSLRRPLPSLIRDSFRYAAEKHQARSCTEEAFFPLGGSASQPGQLKISGKQLASELTCLDLGQVFAPPIKSPTARTQKRLQEFKSQTTARRNLRTRRFHRRQPRHLLSRDHSSHKRQNLRWETERLQWHSTVSIARTMLAQACQRCLRMLHPSRPLPPKVCKRSAPD